MEQFSYKNVMEVPRLVKITLNMGVGEAVGDKKIMDNAVNDMMLISGQKPVVNNARKSEAGFKIREGYPVGCKVTLRGARMAGVIPAIFCMSPTAFSITFLSATASPTPMFSVIFWMRGTSMTDL